MHKVVNYVNPYNLSIMDVVHSLLGIMVVANFHQLAVLACSYEFHALS